ncbi:MAG: DUF4231 domain-containing protein [Chloroflexi bacterium]|nr:DUF4231 domain-containing protein [Chloroflexota bacterium]
MADDAADPTRESSGSSARASGFADYPALYSAADAASQIGQSLYSRFVRSDLTLLVLAPVMSAVASLSMLPAAFSVPLTLATILVLILSIFVKLVNRLGRYDRDWFDGRAVAESVKTATWRYMMRAEPYDRDNSTAETKFLGDLRAVLESRRDLRQVLEVVPHDARQVTPTMERIRAEDWTERKAYYIQNRLRDQIHWYSAKAGASRRRANQWFLGGLGAQIAAIFMAVAKIELLWLPSLVGVFTSMAAVTAAWSQFRRHDEQIKTYGVAAQELITLRDLVERAVDEPSFIARVVEAEEAVSREHTMWLVKHK